MFFNLLGTDATEELEAIAADIAPQLAAHTDKLYLNEQLYGRITAVTPPDDPESRRLHDHILRQFRRHGAALDAEDKQRLTQLNERLSVLAEQFTHNLREETTRLAVAFERDELQGLDEGRIASAAEDAQALGQTGYVIPLGLPTVQEEQAVLELPAARARLDAARATPACTRHPFSGAGARTARFWWRSPNCGPSVQSFWDTPPMRTM